MKIAIIVSKEDQAGMNIKDKLTKLNFKKIKDYYKNEAVYQYKNAKLYTENRRTVDCENIDEDISADLFIFATKHQSKSGIPSLSVHAPGNWGKAEMGGKNNYLCISPADKIRQGYLLLKKVNFDGDIILECTHHGPALAKPVMFIEIGSTKKEWIIEKYGKMIASVIIKLIDEEPKNCVKAFGIGGPHHTPNFQKVLENHKISIGHICPKYKLEDLNENTFEQAINKVKGKVELVICDWKGTNQKDKVKELCDKFGFELKKTKEF